MALPVVLGHRGRLLLHEPGWPWSGSYSDVIRSSESNSERTLDTGGGVMDNGLDKALVHQVLVHAEAYPWVLQDIGLLGLRLDQHREYRLHLWDPSSCVGEPPIHDHPFDFESRIIAGEMINTRYSEDQAGIEYRRIRYAPDNEDDRRTTDTVRLSGTVTTYTESGHYVQLAHELHDSRQIPGTVTIIRRTFKDVGELTVCLPDDAPWVSGRSRPATSDEVKQFAAKALTWF
jgi:hypothetical protein